MSNTASKVSMKFFSVSLVPPEFTRTKISATSSSSAFELILSVGRVYMPRLRRSLRFSSTRSSSSSVSSGRSFLLRPSSACLMKDLRNLDTEWFLSASNTELTELIHSVFLSYACVQTANSPVSGLNEILIVLSL